jgi:hypothetical protein
MTKSKFTEDLSTLQMALVGYQLEKQRIDAKMHEIRAMLNGNAAAAPLDGARAAAPKRVLSPAARKRIAAGQKRRWAEQRKREALAKGA